MESFFKLKSGDLIPKLGIGTWHMGENKKKEAMETEAIETAIKNGCTLIDTAEMYSEGRSENLIGNAIKNLTDVNRNDLFLVSKVYPHNASRNRLFKSLEASMSRLGVGYLDLYLLHWRGSVPLSETVAAMEEAVGKGLIKNWGVSNFDLNDMEELYQCKDGKNCSVNQVLYHLGSRGVDYDLAPWLEKNKIALMAYCPLAQAGGLGIDILKNRVLVSIAQKHRASPAQVALSFIIRFENRIAIPKSSNKERVLENCRSKDVILDDEDMGLINREFPPPTRKMSLDIV